MDDQNTTTRASDRPGAVVGFDGVIRSTNDAWRAFFDEDGARSLSEVIYRLIAPADRTKFLSCWETLAPVDSTVRCEVRAIAGAGDVDARTWSMRTRRGFDDVFVTISDGSRASSRADLDEFWPDSSADSVVSDSAFRDAILSTLSTVGNGIAVARGDSIVWVNQALCEIFGYEPDELIGTDGLHLVAEEDRKRVVSIRRRRRSGEAVTRYYEMDGVKKSGDIVRVELAVETIQLQGDARVVMTCRDVSERIRRQETELRVRRLESMARVAGAIGREYNEVTMAFELLGDALRVRLGDEELHEMKQFDAAIRRAITLTRRLITLEEEPLSRAQFVDLNVVVWEVCHEIEGQLEMRLETRLTPGIPVVRVDRDLVELVLHELLDNAAMASRTGARVLVETSFLTVTEDDPLGPSLREGRYAVLRVIDDGEGIRPEVMEHVFEPFFTTHPATSSGLGLATVRGVMRQMGGHVVIDSSLMSGTRVEFFIPIGEEKPDVKTRRSKVVPGDVQILLTDSSEMIRDLLRSGLQRLGYGVRSVVSKGDALAIIEGGSQVDILITEPLSYDETIAFVQQVRTYDGGLPIILTPGRTAAAYGQLPSVLPNLSFLHKPFGVDRLDQEIRLSLGSRTTVA